MISLSHTLDTSFVIRLLTRDPLPLYQAAVSFLDQWSEGKPGFFVSDLVLAETYYALQHHYGFPKTDALATLQALSRHPAIVCTPHARKILAISRLASAKPGFIDRLIHGASQDAGTSLITFEKSARKLPGAVVLA